MYHKVTNSLLIENYANVLQLQMMPMHSYTNISKHFGEYYYQIPKCKSIGSEVKYS